MNPNDGPDVIEQVSVVGNPMKPTSGTYGDVADTERLKQQLNLPGGGQGGAAMQPTQAPPPGMPQGAQVPSSPGGVPDVLLKPTGQPDTPASTPLAPGVPPGSPSAVTGAQRRLAILSALAQSDTVSDETREWAADVLEKLASRSRS